MIQRFRFALRFVLISVGLLVVATACGNANTKGAEADGANAGDAFEFTPPMPRPREQWPFVVAPPEAPQIERTVEVRSNVELDEALANGAKTHIIVRYAPVEMKRAWLFRLDGRNHDCILEFADRDTEVRHRLEIHPLARRCVIIGGRFPSIRFGATESGQRPKDIKLEQVTVQPTQANANAVDLCGERILFTDCTINAHRKYAVWSDAGLSQALFEHCHFGESGEESPVRMYNCRKVVFLGCVFRNHVDLKPADSTRKVIKAAARIMASDQVGYFACTFMGSGLWINMPPGPGRTEDNGAVYVDACRFLHEAATNLPIEAWGTRQLTVTNCEAMSVSRKNFMSTANDVMLDDGSGMNRFMHVKHLPQATWLERHPQSTPMDDQQPADQQESHSPQG